MKDRGGNLEAPAGVPVGHDAVQPGEEVVDPGAVGQFGKGGGGLAEGLNVKGQEEERNCCKSQVWGMNNGVGDGTVY